MKRLFLLSAIQVVAVALFAQGVKFQRDLAPATGLLSASEQQIRHELCLNGKWDVQCIDVPESWKEGQGIAPELPLPKEGKWESTQIKIPSPLNVNNWGGGYKTGEGTNAPYRPSSVYYPSYPEHWNNVRMAWLRKRIQIPSTWNGMQVLLHFEAVSGYSQIFVNGKEVGTNFDNHTPFDIDITDAVIPGQTAEVMVGLRHPRLFDKKNEDYKYMSATYPTGSNTDGLLGIWQDVFLHAVPMVSIEDVFIKPLVSKHTLRAEVTIVNHTQKNHNYDLCGDIYEWVNKAPHDGVQAAEPLSAVGNKVMVTPQTRLQLKAGESKTFIIECNIKDELSYWSPDAPNLYNVDFCLMDGNHQAVDIKTTRFGWRELKIEGSNFVLNGKKIQCFGDIQHPFSAYICSRRFAWAWFKMIKDFGGNAVRPHAQPWPRCYYDLADEMGIMVLAETGLFGSSIRANFEEEITWDRCAEQLHRLIMRDRNHPSVIGWSAGNETFAIALLNKPPKEIAQRWDKKLVELANKTYQWDDTRQFVTLDGDRDMNGQLPVWSKHFGHNLNIGDLPKDINKPLIVGECGATYYGRPSQLYPFAGEQAFESYEGRNKALAVDLFQNVRQMAMPYVSYFSPSEVSWFGIEHLGLGYHDNTRLPNLNDGIFPEKPYEEGKPGYQYERIPPYVTTFNPYLDTNLPVYKPLAMFDAYKAALNGSTWEPFKDIKPQRKPELPDIRFESCTILSECSPRMAQFLGRCGITLSSEINKKKPCFVVLDASEINEAVMKQINNLPKGSLVLCFAKDTISSVLAESMPAELNLEHRPATALEVNKNHRWCYGYELPDLYFAEADNDKYITKCNITGNILNVSDVLFTPSRTDWSLFNNVAEHWKCAQVVLYEYLKREPSATLINFPWKNSTMALTTIDWTIDTPEIIKFWKGLFGRMGVAVSDGKIYRKAQKNKAHDLLMDGPVD